MELLANPFSKRLESIRVCASVLLSQCINLAGCYFDQHSFSHHRACDPLLLPCSASAQEPTIMQPFGRGAGCPARDEPKRSGPSVEQACRIGRGFGLVGLSHWLECNDGSTCGSGVICIMCYHQHRQSAGTRPIKHHVANLRPTGCIQP